MIRYVKVDSIRYYSIRDIEKYLRDGGHIKGKRMIYHKFNKRNLDSWEMMQVTQRDEFYHWATISVYFLFCLSKKDKERVIETHVLSYIDLPDDNIYKDIKHIFVECEMLLVGKIKQING